MVDSERQRDLSPAEGTVAAGRHLLPVRVYYEDTDFSGVVYHASYLRFLERGRTEFLRAAGVDQSALHAEGEGLIFAVRRLIVDYLKPARMDDVLLVETSTAEVRGASLAIAQRILRGDEALVTADVRVAAIVAGRPARIPDALRAVLSPRAPPLPEISEGRGASPLNTAAATSPGGPGEGRREGGRRRK